MWPVRAALWQDLALESPRHPRQLGLGREAQQKSFCSIHRPSGMVPAVLGGPPCFFGSCGPVLGETWTCALLSPVPCHEGVPGPVVCPSFVGHSSGVPGKARGLVGAAMTHLAVFSCRNGSVGSSSSTSTGCCATPSTRW